MKLSDFANIHIVTPETSVRPTDILLQRVGVDDTVGKPFLGNDPATPRNTIIVSLNETGSCLVHPQYLYYMLTALHSQGYFSRLARGTAQQFIKVSDVKDVPISLG